MKITHFILFTICFSFLPQQVHAQQLLNPFLPPVQEVNNTTTNIRTLPGTPLAQEQLLSYPLNYAQAKDVQAALKDLLPKLSYEAVTNSLILQGSATEHARLRTLLSQLDVATKQITLEAKIVALNNEESKNIGISWNWDTIPQRNENNTDSDTNTDSTYGGNFKFWRGYAFRFNAALNALVAQGKARILATPRIITIPGREANIFIGDHIPVQTEKHDSSGTYTATEYLDAGIKLQYTPIVNQDGNLVTASVHTEVSTPILISELKNYRITSRTANTNVRMYNGETLIIGGLISAEEQRTLQQIPLLSKIPLLGALFTNRSKKSSSTEVMLLLTPHITEAGVSPAIYNERELLALKKSSIDNISNTDATASAKQH